MAEENKFESEYVIIKADDTVEIQSDAHINDQNVDTVTFQFADGQDITESVARKNAKNKTAVTYTKKGRSAYAPVTVIYADGESESHNFVIENCIIQWTKALDAANHSYAKDFVFIGISDIITNKIIEDARHKSQMKLGPKPNVNTVEGHFWFRCNLDKLTFKNTKIITEQGPVSMSLDSMLQETKKSIVAAITFSMSASMNNNDMNEDLDLKDGQYTITLKPSEIFAYDVTDIQGPTLQDTNRRKQEGSIASPVMVAKGKLAEMAAKRLRK